ncbi:GroES-like protein [Penicillium lividum]|nr:GroES-like protein [Penicillium lividum]
MTAIKSKKINGTHSVQEIPTTQWAQVFEKKASALMYTQIPVPSISPDDLLVQIHYSGVCHTDLHAWKGLTPENAWKIFSANLEQAIGLLRPRKIWLTLTTSRWP